MSKVLFLLADNMDSESEDITENLSRFIFDNEYDNLVLIGSKLVLDKIPSLKHYYKSVYDTELNINVLILKDLEDIDYIFERFKYKLKEFPDSEIIINYTFGSNKLAAVTILIAKMYGLKIQENLNIEDTSKFKEFKVIENDTNINSLYFVKKSFNNYNFNLAMDVLHENFSPLDNVEKYFTKLIEIYINWDSFIYEGNDFNEIKDYFKNLTVLPKNIKAMKILADDKHKLNNAYKIADLINNSRRRIEEKKLDDAVIRLYRTLELISEVELYEKYNIRKGDVHFNELKQLDIDKYSLKKIRSRLDYKYPKYNIPLTTSFFLLQKLYDDVGKHYYYNKGKYQQLFQKRNISVLVHGNYKYEISELEEMYELVVDIARIYNKDMDKYIEETKFPKFKI